MLSLRSLSLVLALSAATAHAQQSFSHNIVSVSPVQMSENTPTGVGLQYEHILGDKGKWSLYLPLAYSFGHSDPCDDAVRTHMFYAYPGVRFYPLGNAHAVTYSIGPSLAFGYGNTNCNCTIEGNSEHTEQLTSDHAYHSATEVGVLLNAAINIHATKHLLLGSELGLGTTCINTVAGQDMGAELMINFNVRIGYML